MKNQERKIPPSKDVYLLKILTALLFELLESVLNSGFTVRITDDLEVVYLKACRRIGELSNGRFPRPFQSFYTLVELDAFDKEWAWGAKPNYIEFSDLVTEWYIKGGERKYKLKDISKKDKELINQLAQRILQYKKYREADIKNFPKFLEKIKEHLQTEETPDRFCRWENNCFFISLVDGSPKSINFESKRGKQYMIVVFDVLYKQWLENKEEPLTKEKIRRLAKTRLSPPLNPNWLKNTISNIRKKIRASSLFSYVSIDYDTVSGGYNLKIKKPA